jgi:D-serine deaminase-like pyridoxal phosphate-dependent protein
MIDVNVGMNRTGVSPDEAPSLAYRIQQSFGKLNLTGLHGYDGHIHDTDLKARKQNADISYNKLAEVQRKISSFMNEPLALVMGGTVTFPVHIQRPGVECSPGTFGFWEWGYRSNYPDLPFQCAAFLACRVISVIDEHHVCIDLGYKSVASENPLPRIYFPDIQGVRPVAQSEEHLVLEAPDSKELPIGTVLFGIPEHICPTVALYEKMWVVQNGMVNTSWKIIARDRCINI